MKFGKHNRFAPARESIEAAVDPSPRAQPAPGGHYDRDQN